METLEIVQTTELEVTGPFTWLKQEGETTPWLFNAIEAKRGGVYLMAVMTPAGWLIFWVGQTRRPFHERFRTHSREYLAGTYNVLDAADLQSGRRTVLWRGLWWRKSSADRYEEYLLRAGEVTPHTRALLQATRIFLIPFDADKRMLERLEAAIVRKLYADRDVGKILDEGYHLVPRWKTEAPAAIRISGPTFLGLPQVLEI